VASFAAGDNGPASATVDSTAQPSGVTAEVIGAALALTHHEQSLANTFSELVSEEDDLEQMTRAVAVLEFTVDTPSADSSASITPVAKRSDTAEAPKEDWFTLSAVDEAFADAFG
jgi:hypothetical protein